MSDSKEKITKDSTYFKEKLEAHGRFGDDKNEYEISDEVIYSSTQICSGDFSTIENTTFLKDVIFENIDFKDGIKFLNCTFKRRLIFRNSKSEGMGRFVDYQLFNMILENCNINFLIFNISEDKKENKLKQGLKIYNKTIINHFIIDSLNILEGTFLIDDVKINGIAHFKNITMNLNDPHSGLDINKLEIMDLFHIKEIYANFLSFYESNFNNGLSISNGYFKAGLYFNKGSHKALVSIFGVNNEGELRVEGTKFEQTLALNFNTYDSKKDVTIKEGKHQSIFIKDAQFTNSLIVNGFHKYIEKLNIDLSSLNIGTMLFKNCHFNCTEIIGENQKTNLIFKNVKFNYLTFKDFLNYGNLTLFDCIGCQTESSLFKSANTNLGKAQLFNFDFKTFNNVHLDNTSLLDITYSNVTWFVDTQLNQPVEKTEKYFSNKREIYRQLKQLTDRQGDRIQSLDFQKEEFRAFQELLKLTKSWWHKDRWILRLSKTNDFGLSWSKPFWWILGLTVGFYLLMVIEASPKLDWKPATTYQDINTTYCELVKYLNIIPQLFNPTRSLDKLFPKIENLSFWVHLFDIFQRLLLTFFTFQIVSAFRKYVK
jgi:hypothetical protein